MSSTDDMLADLDDEDADERSSSSPRSLAREDAGGSTPGRRGLRGRLGDRFGHLFSLRAFLLGLGLSGAGLFLSGFVPLLPGAVAALLGVFAGTFLLGLVASTRRYAESAAAGGAVVAVAALVQFLFISVLAGVGPPVAVLSGGAGVLAGLLGHYFGRDLRAGVTRDLD